MSKIIKSIWELANPLPPYKLGIPVGGAIAMYYGNDLERAAIFAIDAQAIKEGDKAWLEISAYRGLNALEKMAGVDYEKACIAKRLEYETEVRKITTEIAKASGLSLGQLQQLNEDAPIDAEMAMKLADLQEKAVAVGASDYQKRIFDATALMRRCIPDWEQAQTEALHPEILANLFAILDLELGYKTSDEDEVPKT
jgi:hypothetical protein